MQKPTAIVKAVPSRRENAKLVAIFIFLSVAATLMSTLYSFNGLEWIRWFMGGLMIMFGGFKLVGIEVFIKVFPLYDIIAKRLRPYKYAYSLLQVILGMMFITGSIPLVRNGLTIGMGLSGLVGMLQVVSKRGPIRLSYLGTIIRLRFSTVILIENTLMVCLGAIMLIAELVFK